MYPREMFHNARTMTFCLTQFLQLKRTLLRSRSHHFLAPQKLLTKGIKNRYMCSQNESANQTEADEFYEESPYTNIDVVAIAGDDPVKIHELKKIQLEIDMMRQQGDKVPTNVTTKQWIEILNSSTLHARIQLYNFLWLNESRKLKKKERRNRLREEFLGRRGTALPPHAQLTTNDIPTYGLSHNSLFYRISLSQIHQFYNLKLLYASMFNNHIVVDCSYESFMTQRNISICAKQVMLMFAENREYFDPSHLLFCNMNIRSELYSKMKKMLFPLGESDFPFFHTPKSYLDVYPKNKLVYLTPHCSEELHSYNPDDVYIIGAFVDKNRSEPLSLAKAKKEDIRMAKFPLDRYLKWQMGIKSLTVNQCLAIMNDLRTTRDWNYALKHVPSRKAVRFEEEEEEKLERISTFASAKLIREQYRRNLVYDLLMKEANKIDKDKPA